MKGGGKSIAGGANMGKSLEGRRKRGDLTEGGRQGPEHAGYPQPCQHSGLSPERNECQ